LDLTQVEAEPHFKDEHGPLCSDSLGWTGSEMAQAAWDDSRFLVWAATAYVLVFLALVLPKRRAP